MNGLKKWTVMPLPVPFCGFNVDQNGRQPGAYSFPCMRVAAPSDGHTAPPANAFCLVRCCELSQAGISFFSPVRPGSKRFVLPLNDRGEIDGGTALFVLCKSHNSGAQIAVRQAILSYRVNLIP